MIPALLLAASDELLEVKPGCPAPLSSSSSVREVEFIGVTKDRAGKDV